MKAVQNRNGLRTLSHSRIPQADSLLARLRVGVSTICLLDMEKVDLALAVTKQNGYYTANTCLTLDMAYNNARLIAKPSNEWLTP